MWWLKNLTKLRKPRTELNNIPSKYYTCVRCFLNILKILITNSEVTTGNFTPFLKWLAILKQIKCYKIVKDIVWIIFSQLKFKNKSS